MSNTSYTMPTLEEIELLQKGKLNPAREAEIKTLAKSNPLVAEALEGFAILPVFAAVPGAESFLNMVANAPGSTAAAGGAASSAAASSGAASTGAAVAADVAVKTAAWFGAKTLIIAGVSATVAVTGTLLVVNQDDAENNAAQNALVVPSQQNSTDNVNVSPSENGVNTDGVVPNEENNNTAIHNTLSEGHTVTYQDAQTIASIGNTMENRSAADHSITWSPDESIPVDPNIASLNNATTDGTSGADAAPRADISGKVMAIGIQSILHYKVADYTKVVSNKWKPFDVDPGGVPAQFESEEAKQLAAQEAEVIQEIPYLDYLTLCIRAMDKNDYGLALSHFQLVLDQYPDDVNGLFYSAQCHYYLGNYEKSIGLYDQTMRNMINKFNEEAEFYKAKSLKALGRNAEATKIFEGIVAKGKFYSAQAGKELE